MEMKTKVSAGEGAQDILITREFNLPVELLFRAYAEASIVEQWMGSKVLKMENRKYGGYQFEKKDADGNVVFKANGVIHDFVGGQKITRTFEMENANFGVQLEFIEFAKLTDATSKLTIQTVYRSAELRNQMLKLPFAQGLNWAHNRLEEVLSNLK